MTDRTSSDSFTQAKPHNTANVGENSKRPLFPNLVWKREVDEGTESLTTSLLTRIEQPQASLLKRITPVKKPAGDYTAGGSELTDAEEDMPAKSEHGPSTAAQPSNGELADILIASALAEASKAAVDMGKGDLEQNKVTLPVESAASISLAEAAADGVLGASSSVAGRSETHGTSEESDPTQTELVEQAKQLLVPIITQNARLRDPDADIEVIKTRVMSLITDEQCLDFLKLAKDVQQQMRLVGETNPSGEITTSGTNQVQASAALTAVNGTTAMETSQSLNTRAAEDPVRKSRVAGSLSTRALAQPPPSSRSVTPTAAMPPTRLTPSQSGRTKSPPTAPKAMRDALHRSRRPSASSFMDAYTPASSAALRTVLPQHDAVRQNHPLPIDAPVVALAPRSDTPTKQILADDGDPSLLLPSNSISSKPAPVRAIEQMTRKAESVPLAVGVGQPSEPLLEAARKDSDDKCASEDVYSSPMGVVDPIKGSTSKIAPLAVPANQRSETLRGALREDVEQASVQTDSSAIAAHKSSKEPPLQDASAATIDQFSQVLSVDTTKDNKATDEMIDPLPMAVDEPTEEPSSSSNGELHLVLVDPTTGRIVDDALGGPETAVSMDLETPIPLSFAVTTPSELDLKIASFPADEFASEVPPSMVIEPHIKSPMIAQPNGSPQSYAIEVEVENQPPTAAIQTPTTESTPLVLPQLLHVAAGSGTPDVTEIVFQVDEALGAATCRWSARQTYFDPAAAYASVYLLCLPTAQVRATYEQVGISASAERYANALWNIRTIWPPKGKLMVEINRGGPMHYTFLPQQMGLRDGPLELTAFIQAGKNTLQLIQLANSAAHLFILLARKPLSGELKWQNHMISVGTPMLRASASSLEPAKTITVL